MSWIDVPVPADAEQRPPKAQAVTSQSLDRQSLQNELDHKILSMQNAQMVRLLQASAWHSYIVLPEVVQSTVDVNKKHAEQTRAQSGHTLGAPHVQ